MPIRGPDCVPFDSTYLGGNGAVETADTGDGITQHII